MNMFLWVVTLIPRPSLFPALSKTKLIGLFCFVSYPVPFQQVPFSKLNILLFCCLQGRNPC